MPAEADLAGTLLAVLRGIMSTARMFSLSDDYSVLAGLGESAWLTDNIWPQVLFWTGHVSALITIKATLFSIFGRKLIDSLKLKFGRHKEVYIIKGNDNYAAILSENIATHDAQLAQPDENRLIVLITSEEGSVKNKYEEIAHFAVVVNMANNKNSLVNCLVKTGFGKWFYRKKKYNIILGKDETTSYEDVLRVLEYALSKKVSPDNLNIFALISSEWNREKVEELALVSEKTEKKYPYTIHIIDEKELMIRQMIQAHPPYECHGLKINEKGIAAHNFTVIILGFDKVGQQALLRLIMNGQFVGSRMKAIVIDRDISHLKEHFIHCNPSLHLSCDIEFLDYDVRDKGFFKLLGSGFSCSSFDVDYVDYIVIALGEDSASKQTALDIKLHYERKNASALPLIAVYDKNGAFHDERYGGKIFTFGCLEEVYKDAIIIREESDKVAKAVNNTYAALYGGKQWHELDWFLQESNRASADFIPAMLKLSAYEKADMEKLLNSEVLTKDKELAEILAQTEHLRWVAFHAAMGYSPISIAEMRQRFNSFEGEKNSREHLDFCRRDTKSKLHLCLVHWDDLDEVSEAYRDLAALAGNHKEQTRDFKDNDRDVVKNIPKFLRTAR